eukprot:5694016-Prymnesium_polylepis.1
MPRTDRHCRDEDTARQPYLEGLATLSAIFAIEYCMSFARRVLNFDSRHERSIEGLVNLDGRGVRGLRGCTSSSASSRDLRGWHTQ